MCHYQVNLLSSNSGEKMTFTQHCPYRNNLQITKLVKQEKQLIQTQHTQKQSYLSYGVACKTTLRAFVIICGESGFSLIRNYWSLRWSRPTRRANFNITLNFPRSPFDIATGWLVESQPRTPPEQWEVAHIKEFAAK